MLSEQKMCLLREIHIRSLHAMPIVAREEECECYARLALRAVDEHHVLVSRDCILVNKDTSLFTQSIGIGDAYEALRRTTVFFVGHRIKGRF